MQRVHGLGVVAVEAFSRAISPATQPHPQVLTDSLRMTPGGGAGATAAALAQLGVPVGIFARVGDDGHGVFVREALRKLGVDVTCLLEAPGAETPLSYVTLRADGQRSVVTTPGAYRSFSPRDLPRAVLWPAQFLYYSDLGALPGWDGAPAVALLAEARQRGLVTVVGVNAATPPGARTFEKVVAHADWVLASSEDLQAIYPGRHQDAWLARLRQVGARQVLLQLGAAGCLLMQGEDVTPFPSAVRTVEATGTGACCAAGFLAGLAAGYDPPAAARVSQLAAAWGGTRGLPRLAVLLARA